MQLYKWMTILFLALFFMFMALGFSKIQREMTTNFDTQQIQLYNNQLVYIGNKIQQNELKNSAIKDFIEKINTIKNYANACTLDKQKHILQLKELSNQLSLDKANPIPESLSNQFITEENSLAEDGKKCALMEYEAEKKIDFANNIMLVNNQSPKFKSIFELARVPSLFQRGDLKLRDTKEIFGIWSLDFCLKALAIFFSTFLIGILISLFIFKHTEQLITKNQQYILKYFSFIFPPVISLFSVWLLMFNDTQMLKTPPPLVNIIYFTGVFILLRFVCDINLKIIYKDKINSIQWTQKISRYINYIFLTMYFNLIYSFVVRDVLIASDTSAFLIKCANLISFAFWVEWLLLLGAFRDKHFPYRAKFKKIVIFTSFAISSIYLLRITTSLLQINPSVDNFISNTTLKICTMGLFIYLVFVFNHLLYFLENILLTHSNMRKWFVFIKFQGFEIWELHIIRLCLLTLVIIFSNSYLFVVLGLPDSFLESYNSFFYEGIKVAQINFAPCVILYSLITFCLFSLIGKSIAFHIASHASLEGEIDKKNTLERTFRYLSYVLAFVMTMYIWGIKVQELYFMAGAVSLGIGIGLKSLILDAISGLLILFIKPVRIGDFITIIAKGKENVSGNVYQIDFLSTQIISQHSNLTRVPNGILFNEYIVNFSNFQANSHGYLALTLNNIKDFERCREIMLEIADETKEIIHASYQKPIVSFDFIEDDKGQDLAVINLSFHVKNPENKMLIYKQLEKQIIAKLNESGVKVLESKDSKIFF